MSWDSSNSLLLDGENASANPSIDGDAPSNAANTRAHVLLRLFCLQTHLNYRRCSPDCSPDEKSVRETIASGGIFTSWQREAKTLICHSIPLIATYSLQYSINAASVFAVGRIGKIELGAVSCRCLSILAWRSLRETASAKFDVLFDALLSLQRLQSKLRC